jgi:hypothetical protein
MKNNFNFLQVANWAFVIREKLKKFRLSLDEEIVDKQSALRSLKEQKRQLELIKDILNKKIRLFGIQQDFLRNLKKIKQEYGIEE